jgi:hypothetical protein
MEEEMEELDVEGVATHGSPESCVVSLVFESNWWIRFRLAPCRR